VEREKNEKVLYQPYLNKRLIDCFSVSLQINLSNHKNKEPIFHLGSQMLWYFSQCKINIHNLVQAFGCAEWIGQGESIE
jgi:hypothetical protein